MNRIHSAIIFVTGQRRCLPLILIIILALASPATAARLKDIASVKGVRSNQLVGYGLVVGLDGTGDGNQATFTSFGLVNMLENLGIHLGTGNINVKNVAGVMITAKLPAFAKSGGTIDVTISSLGDATSLQGGTLIASPLKGLDGKVYAIAQGPVSIGGFEVAGAGFGGQKNHLTVARIPGGATVEREVPLSFDGQETITISLNRPDFTTVSRTVQAIDRFLDGSFAKARDGATIDIQVPEQYNQAEVALLAAIENLQVTPDGIAKVVLDERTGTIVMGENVRIDEIAISHGTLSIQVRAETTPQTDTGNTGFTGTTDNTDNLTAHRLINLPQGVTLGEVVQALNSVGVTPRDLIAIFQSIKAAGALRAELEII